MSDHDPREPRNGALDPVDTACHPAARSGASSDAADGAADRTTAWSRRRFLGTAALGGVVCTASTAGLLLWNGATPARSGLVARELQGEVRLRFAHARTRPGFQLRLDAELPQADPRARSVRAVLAHRRGTSYEPLATVALELHGGAGGATLSAPMSQLDAAERANEGFELVALLVADDDPSRAVIGEPVEVVVSPFVPGM